MGPRTSFLCGVAGATIVLLSSSAALAQMCTKIANNLGICDVLANTCQSAQGTPACNSNGTEKPDAPCVPTPGQERFFYQQLYTDPPGNGVTAQAAYQDACEKWWQWEKIFVGTWPNGYGGPVQAVLLKGGGAECRINYKWPKAGPMVSAGVIGTDTFPREPQCNRTPNGPYTNIDMPWNGSGTPGAFFNRYDRRRLPGENIRLNDGDLVSDAHTAGAAEPWPNFEDTPNMTPDSCPVEDLDTDPNSYPNPVPPPPPGMQACFQVDHIIPRKDKYGCDCGDDSKANAALISRELNTRMSNFMSDPDRIILLQEYTLP